MPLLVLLDGDTVPGAATTLKVSVSVCVCVCVYVYVCDVCH